MSKSEIKKNSKRKSNNDDDVEEEEEKWMKLSRDEIIQRCKQLEKHVQQLRNTINKTNEKESNEKKKKSIRPFDFNKHSKRHIFLKFIYLGWEYHVRKKSREKKKLLLKYFISGFCHTRNNITNSRRLFIRCFD